MDERVATGALKHKINKFEELGLSADSTLDSAVALDTIVTDIFNLKATVFAHSPAADTEIESAMGCVYKALPIMKGILESTTVNISPDWADGSLNWEACKQLAGLAHAISLIEADKQVQSEYDLVHQVLTNMASFGYGCLNQTRVIRMLAQDRSKPV